jgi:hypothetical protein
MTSVAFVDQLAALRRLVFEAVADWNAAHPHARGSQRARGLVSVTQIFSDAAGKASYSITVVCPLSGSSQLTFHGHDPVTVVEQARLTVERKTSAERQRRENEAYQHELNRKFGIAV